MSHTISETFVDEFVKEHWGLIGSAKRLAGYEDLNYLLRCDDKKYLIKISIGAFSESLDFQIQALKYIARNSQDFPVELPILINSSSDQDYIDFDHNENTYICRVHSWVPGQLMTDYEPKSKDLLRDLGRKAAMHQKLLDGFRHPAEKRENFEWDLANLQWLRAELENLDDNKRMVISHFLGLYEANSEVYDQLPKAVIHNDINDYNILVNDHQISGFIDYGDMIYTQRINDLAILLAYACMDKPDPISSACEIINAYNEIVPLKEEELSCLFHLIALRNSVTVTQAAINYKLNPDNEYLLVSSAPALALLTKLYDVDPDLAEYRFRNACQMNALAQSDLFKLWVSKNEGKWSNVCPLSISSQDYFVLDLGIGSSELGHFSEYNNARLHETKIKALLQQKQKSFAIGKFNEIRPLYSSDEFTAIGNEGHRWRTCHIGLDFFHDEGMEVYAFFDGEIFAVHYNEGDKNYGNTVIIKHETTELSFYTLYGHLSSESVSDLQRGKKVKTGEYIASTGSPTENGNWAPHLHFQIILDMLGNAHDFPGVCFVEERDLYTQICPDPSPLFNITIDQDGRIDKNEILSKRKEVLGRSYSISYSEPLYIQRAYMQYLYDEKGRKFLDCVNNVPHVGHQNDKVYQAACRQMALLNTNTRYLHENIVSFAESLTATLPDKLSVAHFVNSGSEANELAIRMARTSTNRNDILVMEHGYHGNTNLCVDLSSYKFEGKGGKGKKDYIHMLEMPDPLRGRHKGPNCGQNYVNDALQKIDSLIDQGITPAAFICESILSCGGQVTFPSGYLKSLYDGIRQRGIVIIADEVQVGLGRIGSHWWAFENEGVVPDIMTIGKPIGNGHPLAVVVCSESIAEAFNNGMEYFNTFGGNPVSSIIGKTVIDYVQDEGLLQNALERGNEVKSGFELLKKRHPIIADVRGHGLFLGWEFVKDTELTPAAAQASYFVNRAKENGILLSTDGPLHNVIKFKPPMIFTSENVAYLLEVSSKILNEEFMKV